ncbi:hypothetical protein [Embleya scabrispora]|uniref:hypothetical protein n=1 Tax=Embleya scabrispora TaxID=159449 RepID=UPI000376E115|nr:hypothetical protein [Embleya scabrispora]MYS83834.1 hypothetical protein [Streptomyces sp. SID5474]
MKLHRTGAYLDGRPYTLITLRPSTTTRFAVNHFHDSWHVLSDLAGARLFARLLWGLAYGRHENTVVVIDRRFLDPNPFEAEPSLPIVLFATERTPFGGRAARDLRRVLPTLGTPDGTVRWRTHGLTAALTDRAVWQREHPTPPRDRDRERRHKRKPHHTVRDGLLVLPGTAEALLREAVSIASLTVSGEAPMAYEYLHHFEFQVFHDYRRRVSAARVARREIEALPVPPDRFTGRGYHEEDPVRRHIWVRGIEIRKQRMRGRRVVRRPALYQARSINEIQRSGETPFERLANISADE